MCVPRLPALESADTVAPAPTRADVWRHVGCGADRDQISQCCPSLPLYNPWQSAAHQAQNKPINSAMEGVLWNGSTFTQIML